MATLFHGTVMCPGESEFQLGYTVRFELDDEWEKSVEEKRSGERFDYANAESALTDLQAAADLLAAGKRLSLWIRHPL